MKAIIATEEILNAKGTHIIKVIYHYADGTKSKGKKVFIRVSK